MKPITLAMLALAGIAGCAPAEKPKDVTPEEAARRAGLRREQFSTQGQGTQTIQGADGSTTELLSDRDLGQYGLSLYPGATAKADTVYRKTDPKSITVFYTLMTSDPPANVAKFYEKELGATSKSSGGSGILIVGHLKDGKSGVVTVIGDEKSGTRAEVQILSPK